MAHFDCQSCGVCCKSNAATLLAGRREYVEVQKTDALLRERRDVLKQVAWRNTDGVYHLKVVGDEERCASLEGTMGVRVACTIYALRPKGCRVVQAGDAECLRARARDGLSLTPDAPSAR